MKIHRLIATLSAIALAVASAHGQITVDDSETFTTSPSNEMQRPSPYTFEVDGVFDPNLEAKKIPGALADFNPTGSDKIILAFGINFVARRPFIPPELSFCLPLAWSNGRSLDPQASGPRPHDERPHRQANHIHKAPKQGLPICRFLC